MIKVFLLMFLGLAIGCGVSWVAAGRLVSATHSKVVIPETNLPVKEFSIPSESGATLAGWHVVSEKNLGVVVLLHGVRANKASMFNRAKLLHEYGYSVVLIDFQAHGESSGDFTTTQLVISKNTMC